MCALQALCMNDAQSKWKKKSIAAVNDTSLRHFFLSPHSTLPVVRSTTCCICFHCHIFLSHCDPIAIIKSNFSCTVHSVHEPLTYGSKKKNEMGEGAACTREKRRTQCDCNSPGRLSLFVKQQCLCFAPVFTRLIFPLFLLLCVLRTVQIILIRSIVIIVVDVFCFYFCYFVCFDISTCLFIHCDFAPYTLFQFIYRWISILVCIVVVVVIHYYSRLSFVNPIACHVLDGSKKIDFPFFPFYFLLTADRNPLRRGGESMPTNASRVQYGCGTRKSSSKNVRKCHQRDKSMREIGIRAAFAATRLGRCDGQSRGSNK